MSEIPQDVLIARALHFLEGARIRLESVRAKLDGHEPSDRDLGSLGEMGGALLSGIAELEKGMALLRKVTG